MFSMSRETYKDNDEEETGCQLMFRLRAPNTSIGHRKGCAVVLSREGVHRFGVLR